MYRKLIYPFVFLIVFLFSSWKLMAQSNQDSEEKIEALKIAYITRQLDLSSKEAEKFWPVYNNYSNQLKELRKERKDKYLKNKNRFDSMTDQELETYINDEMAFHEKELKITKEFNEELKKVLPLKKIAKLYIAEEAFKRQLVKKLLDKK